MGDRVRMMMGAGLLLATATLQGQVVHGTEPLPKFESVTIELTPPPPPPQPLAPGEKPRIAAVAMTPPNYVPPPPKSDRIQLQRRVGFLIADAYGFSPAQFGRVLAMPAWLVSNTDEYDITAKIDDKMFSAMQTMPSETQKRQICLMEQSLLAERFKLKVHFETRQMLVMRLAIADGGAKLTPSQPDEVHKLTTGRYELAGTAITLDELTERYPLMYVGGHRVVNETGLKGTYDISLKWGPDNPPASSEGSLPPLSTVVLQELGLKLEQKGIPIEVVVIDHVERPSEN